MKRLLFSMSIILLCLQNIVEAQQERETRPLPWYEIVVYPEEFYFGDPVYIGIRLKNTAEKQVDWSVSSWSRETFWLTLRSCNISVPYYLLVEDDWWKEGHRGVFLNHSFKPDESKLVFVAYQELPALEDMNLPFWQEAKKHLEADESIAAHVTLEYARHSSYARLGVSRNPPDTVFMSSTIRIKPRPVSEMELLERWLEDTPERLLPVPLDRMGVMRIVDAFATLESQFDAFTLPHDPDFISQERVLKVDRNTTARFLATNEHFIQVKNKDYFPQTFLRHGNRKPGDPVCPTTWQGWKELEESLMPSTMRDEIRLTRMLIQYCDTEDQAVLKELKEWFGNMNEIQRASMTWSIRKRALAVDDIMGDDMQRTTISWLLPIPEGQIRLFPSFQIFYQTIRDYDVIMLMTELETQRLKRGLSE